MNNTIGGDALIHLRVTAAIKGRWVNASRAEGLRLSDWIVKIVEAHLNVQPTPGANDDT